MSTDKTTDCLCPRGFELECRLVATGDCLRVSQRTTLPPTEEIQAGDRFRATLIKRADAYNGPAPLWYGWAIMDAFLAGVAWEKERQHEH